MATQRLRKSDRKRLGVKTSSSYVTKKPKYARSTPKNKLTLAEKKQIRKSGQHKG